MENEIEQWFRKLKRELIEVFGLVKSWLSESLKPIREDESISWLQNQWEETPLRIVGTLLLVGSVIFLILDFVLGKFFEDFAANIATDLASIAVTILFIDYLNERRQNKQLLTQLILQMGSRHNDVTDTAVRTLRSCGWLTDGSLKGAYLFRANLQGVDLLGVNLQDADLREVNLQGADLGDAKLQRATLWGAQMQEADLRGPKCKRLI